MRLIFDKLREARRREEGFTLIELLIVILVLGILAGIAVFASTPFANRAADACAGANDKIGIVADAAVDAGVSGDLYADAPDCGSGFGGGGGGGTFTAALVETNSAASGTATVAASAAALDTPEADNLLVAVVGHRTSPTGDPTAAGWTLQGVQNTDTSSSSNRRGIAVFTKVAEGGDSISVTWPGTAGLDMIVREYSSDGTWANTGNFTGTSGTPAGQASPLALTGADGFTGSGLVIAATVGRGAPTAGQSFSGLGGLATTGSDRRLASAFAMVSGAGPHGTSFSWSGGNAQVSGFVLVVR